MRDTKFWRFVAVAFVAAVLYVGHGLHRGGNGVPSLVNSAHAGGVTTMNGLIYTSDATGRTLHVWKLEDGVGKPHHLWSVDLQGPK
jgi:hypothetical protein